MTGLVGAHDSGWSGSRLVAAGAPRALRPRLPRPGFPAKLDFDRRRKPPTGRALLHPCYRVATAGRPSAARRGPAVHDDRRREEKNRTGRAREPGAGKDPGTMNAERRRSTLDLYARGDAGSSMIPAAPYSAIGGSADCARFR